MPLPEAADPQTQATPWVFRHRSTLIGIAFLLAWLSGLALGHVQPYASWTGRASLPANLLVGPNGAPGGPPYWPLALPIALGLAGAALRWWGTSYLRGHVMADKEMHSDRLIVAGPFRFVRNPLYVGNLFIAAAWGLYFPPPALPVAVALMLVAVAVVARAEAEGLRKRHGAAYGAYARRVPAFWPTLRPAPATADVRPDWLNGLTSELWGFLVPLYLAAIATRQNLAALLVLAVVVAGLLYRRQANRKARLASGPPPSP